MPAMPMFNQNGEPIHRSWSRVGDGSLSGLTKREMLAKDADVTDLMATLCDDTIKGLADGKLNWDRFTDKAKAYFTVEAKFKMIKADALLAELEK